MSSPHSIYTLLKLHLCTHMHHQWYCLHLNWCWGAQPSVFEVLEDTGIEMIFRLQLIKCTHRVWNVRAVHIYTVLGPNTIHLQIKQTIIIFINIRMLMGGNSKQNWSCSHSFCLCFWGPFPDEDVLVFSASAFPFHQLPGCGSFYPIKTSMWCLHCLLNHNHLQLVTKYHRAVNLSVNHF